MVNLDLMFLPNRKGTLRRDNDRRQKVHRIALQKMQSDVDSSKPLSMQFARGVDLKKARQEEDRLDYVEKCNRKLVDKMMMIMQGLCGTIVSEQNFPDFNPGTLNHRIRRREMLRIDRDNLALMHRIEGATSSYKRALVKPKHFQVPHMGLFPRSESSVKSAGSRLRSRRERVLNDKRGRAQMSPSVAPPSPIVPRNGLGGGASLTSTLTEPSALREIGSVATPRNARTWPLLSEQRSFRTNERPQNSVDEEDGTDQKDGIDSALPIAPLPPPVSFRATCASSPRTTSSKKGGKRFVRSPDVPPGGTVFHAGIQLGDDHAVLLVTRARNGHDPGEPNGFHLEAYCPSKVSLYSLEISAASLPTFTRGSRTAVRQMFRAGVSSREKWESLTQHLELRPVVRPPRVADDPDRDHFGVAPGNDAKQERQATEISTLAAADAGPASSAETKLDMKDTTRDDTALGEASASVTGDVALEMVLVPPADAPILAIQRVFRGTQTRRKYIVVKVAAAILQTAMRLWRERIRNRRSEAVTKIAAVTRGRRARIRAKKEVAARGIQRKSRAWLKRCKVMKEMAARRIQAAVRRRYLKKRQGDRAELGGLPTATELSPPSGRRVRRSCKGRPRASTWRTSIRLAASGNERSGNSGMNARGGWERGSEGNKLPVESSMSDPRQASVAKSRKTSRATGSGTASTPPRNQRPRPPDARDLTRSPFSRRTRGINVGPSRGPQGVRSTTMQRTTQQSSAAKCMRTAAAAHVSTTSDASAAAILPAKPPACPAPPHGEGAEDMKGETSGKEVTVVTCPARDSVALGSGCASVESDGPQRSASPARTSAGTLPASTGSKTSSDAHRQYSTSWAQDIVEGDASTESASGDPATCSERRDSASCICKVEKTCEANPTLHETPQRPSTAHAEEGTAIESEGKLDTEVASTRQRCSGEDDSRPQNGGPREEVLVTRPHHLAGCSSWKGTDDRSSSEGHSATDGTGRGTSTLSAEEVSSLQNATRNASRERSAEAELPLGRQASNRAVTTSMLSTTLQRESEGETGHCRSVQWARDVTPQNGRPSSDGERSSKIISAPERRSSVPWVNNPTAGLGGHGTRGVEER